MAASLYVAITAVPSAKVAIVDSGEFRRSAVYMSIEVVQGHYLGVRPHSPRRVLYIHFNLDKEVSGLGNNLEGETVLTCTAVQYSILVECL
jgi:hypothetical protein